MSNSIRFEEMTTPQRVSWLAWAGRHDLGGDEKPEYVHHPEKGFCMRVSCAVADRTGKWSSETEYCATPRELCDWAGY